MTTNINTVTAIAELMQQRRIKLQIRQIHILPLSLCFDSLFYP
jgi:hypothetical protein